jgi:hypothetical protein
MLTDVLAASTAAPDDLARDGVALLAAQLLVGRLDERQRRALIEAAMPWTLATMTSELAAQDASLTLSEAGIDHAIIKGPVLAAAWRETFGSDVRTYTDVDILVRRSDVPAVTERLISELGATESVRSVGEVGFALPSGAAIDLHWLVINDEGAVARHRLDTDDLLRRAHTDGTLWRLDPIDSVIHVSLHAVISDGSRLAAAIDLATLLRAGDLDLDLLVRRAQHHRAVLPLAVMTDRAAAVTGFAEAVDLARRLPRSAWRTACRHWARSVRPASGRRWTGGEIIRSTRSSTLSSVSAVVAALPTNVRTQRELRRGASR